MVKLSLIRVRMVIRPDPKHRSVSLYANVGVGEWVEERVIVR